ncbi:hypothetical protein JCM30237_17070 [Halolamina litorea]|uniref:Phosphotransferase enzyme family protein n=1 Tax=Halolamina litorea TaxID=1515593 RepID=A0ABD6BR47_9EURY|nr:hypothetical protein [Halolamina litorea]
MPRTRPVRSGSAPVRDAAVAALGRRVAAVDQRADESYELELESGRTATLRLAARCGDDERLVEPCLLDALRDTDVPAPELLAAVGPETSPFDAAFCIVDVNRGQRLDDVLDLPEPAHERLVREAGAHLAALHNASVGAYTTENGGAYGDLRVPNCHPDSPLVVVDGGDEEVRPAHARWPDRVERLTDRALGGLQGGEFTDLVGPIGAGVAAAGLPERPAAAALHLGYRPANIEFEPGITWPSHAQRGGTVVRTLRGFENASTGDGLLDLAVAEDALISLPLGDTDRAQELTATLRESYVAERGVPTPFGERYAAYLLLARARLLSRLGAPYRVTREHDAYDAAIRFREQVDSLVDTLR